MGNRVDAVVSDIVRSVRDAMFRHDITHEEYLAAQQYLLTFLQAKPYEIPLAVDLFFDATIHDIEMKHRSGSRTNTLGPYFKTNCPTIVDTINTLPGGDPLLLEGRVTDLDGRPLAGAELFIWHSDPNGDYSGFCDHMPDTSLYRGRIVLPKDGSYSVRTTYPCPYTIPHDGPTGALLTAMGKEPWRPAHVHYLINADGFYQHVTQVYFKNTAHNETDCAESVRPELVHEPEFRDGIMVMTRDFKLDRVLELAAAE